MPRTGLRTWTGRWTVPSIHRLTIAKLNSLKRKGLHADGGNLLFRVSDTGTKSWVFRYSLSGRTRDMGLGPYPELGLAEVRERAFGLRKLLIDKIDPIEHRNAQRASPHVASARP
jgi:Arm DNA-binding domain